MASNGKENWKPITSLKGTTNRNYAVSDQGRLASFDKNLNDKLVLKPHINGGFPLITIKSNSRSKALFIHNAVAEMFVKKRNPKCIRVIHLDYNKSNNDSTNLKWVTQAEQIEHSKHSPTVKESIARKVHTGATAKKLDEKKVTQLKKEIWNPKRKLTMKALAEKYNIAEMNLYRIKSGQMWFHVHVEGEPVFPRYKEQLKNIEYHNKKNAKAAAEKVKKAAATKKITDAKKIAAAKKADLIKKNKLAKIASANKIAKEKKLAAAKKKANKAKIKKTKAVKKPKAKIVAKTKPTKLKKDKKSKKNKKSKKK